MGMLMIQLGDDGIESLRKQAGLESNQVRTALQGVLTVSLGTMERKNKD